MKGKTTKDELSRRDVLRGLGGLALTGALGSRPDAVNTFMGRSGSPLLGGCVGSIIPAVANREIAITGVQAYAQKSVAAGETIDFRISSDVRHQLSIVRLGWDTDGPSRDWVVYNFPEVAPSPRSIRPGSYIHVESALGSTAQLGQLTLECWVRTFRAAWQGLMTQYTYPGPCGYGLFLSDGRQPCVYFGDGGSFNGAWLRYGPALPLLQWHHLAAVFNAGTVQFYVNGALVDQASGFPASVTPGAAPLRLGAYGDGANGTSYFLDGDLAMPVIYGRALSGTEIASRAGTRPPSVPSDPAVLGCWPLAEERGANVADASACARSGVIVNRGTWMIGGPGFDAASVPRFDPYDPDSDPARGHALRLSSWDIYDCAWPISQSYQIPSELPPGVYVGRIASALGVYNVTFVVRRAATRPTAPVLVLCATNTWHAYNASLGISSFYQSHPGGQPTYFTGIEMPWSNSADPYQIYIGEYNYSHLVRAERFLHVWLEENGYDFDVISDRDLHLNPGVLSDYRALFIAGHSEYWSGEAYGAVRDFLANGGKVIVASGNTMFWRVSFDNAVIECRKLPSSVGGFAQAQWGELYHEHDHRRGGLMREAGYPAWRAIGLECVGYGGPHVPYRVINPSHDFFQGPEPIGVSVGSELGGPHAVGHEWDARLQQIPGTSTPPIPADYTPVVLAEGRSDNQRIDYHADWQFGTNQVISEIVDWQWQGGGRALSAGSIATGAALHADAKLAALFRNALHQFGVVHRLNVLAIGQDGHFNNKWFDGRSWSPSFTEWDDLGAGFVAHPPQGLIWAPNRLAIMAVSSTGSLGYRAWADSSWSDWLDLGGSFQGRPAAVAWGRNRLDLFARGTDDHLYQKGWDGGAWSDWVDLGGSVASDPAAIMWEANPLAIAVRTTTGSIQFKSSTTAWQDMGGSFAHAPTMSFWGGKSVDLLAIDAGGHLYNRRWDGHAWSATWLDLGGALNGRVHVAVWGPNQFSLFGIGQDGQLKMKQWDGTQWLPSLTGWMDLGGNFVGEPAVASYRGNFLSVVAVGVDGRLQHRLWDGSTWSAWQDMGGNLRASPALFRWVGT